MYQLKVTNPFISVLAGRESERERKDANERKRGRECARKKEYNLKNKKKICRVYPLGLTIILRAFLAVYERILLNRLIF